MSANRTMRIHPASFPSHDILTGHRTGPLGFWRGPDIDTVGVQQVSPHVSRDIAKQWLIDEGVVVDTAEHEALLVERGELLAKLDQAEAAVKQLQNRLARVFPGRKRQKVGV